MRSISSDLKFALRSLLRSPLFTVIAIASLALGIGANTAIFTLANQILLRPLPVQHPEQLVLFDWKGTFSGRMMNDHAFSYPMYADLRDKNPGVFSGIIGRFRTRVDFGYQGVTEQARGELVSGNFFQVLGIAPAVGRVFSQDDDRVKGAHPVVVLGYSYWQKRFGGRAAVLSQTMDLNGHPMTVIGVAPQGFHGVEYGQNTDVYVPMMMKAQVTPTWDDMANRQSVWMQVIGRIRPGVTKQQAEAAMAVLYRQELTEELKARPDASERFRKRFVKNQFTLMDVSDGLSDLRQRTATPLRVLAAMVATLLLVACVNLASLLIARGSSRQREIAIRLSIGAAKSAIVRLVLVESFLLSFLGAALGLLVAVWCGTLLVRLMPGENISLVLSTSPDLPVLLFTFGLAILTALSFGTIPALQASRADIAPVLKAEAGNMTADAGRVRFRKGLIAAQIALSLLLLIGAGLFARSLYRLLNTDAGFQAENLIQFSVDPSLQGYTPERIRSFYWEAQRRIAQIPGLTSVSSSENPLQANDESIMTVNVEGYHPKEEEDTNPHVDAVGANFFATMRIPILAGRDISERDLLKAPKVAVVSQEFARYFFKNENPLGHRFGFGPKKQDGGEIEIVGVCKDVKGDDLRQKPPRFVFLPNQQDNNPSYITFYARTTRDPEAIANVIRSQVRQIDASLPIFDLKTMSKQIDETHFVERSIAILSAAFGLLATLLACIGLYGVMAYSVARRTRELGIRIALGAQQSSVLWIVMREVLILAVIGVVIALPLAFGLGRFVESQLFELKGADPLTLISATITILVVCGAAGFLPAYRAAHINPIKALRYE